jgi:hypothetical protein
LIEPELHNTYVPEHDTIGPSPAKPFGQLQLRLIQHQRRRFRNNVQVFA